MDVKRVDPEGRAVGFKPFRAAVRSVEANGHLNGVGHLGRVRAAIADADYFWVRPDGSGHRERCRQVGIVGADPRDGSGWGRYVRDLWGCKLGTHAR